MAAYQALLRTCRNRRDCSDPLRPFSRSCARATSPWRNTRCRRSGRVLRKVPPRPHPAQRPVCPSHWQSGSRRSCRDSCCGAIRLKNEYNIEPMKKQSVQEPNQDALRKGQGKYTTTTHQTRECKAYPSSS